MSYNSESILPKNTNLDNVVHLIDLLGYKKYACLGYRPAGNVAQYSYYEDKDYKSFSGVELSLNYRNKSRIVIHTRTTVSRSYYDLVHQNYTLRILRKYFGGIFETEYGKNRYFPIDGKPPSPQQSGCHIAFQRFGHNLIKADIFIISRVFPQKQWKEITKIWELDEMNPRLFSNNLLIPYIVSTIEDYYRSTFIALLKYSNRKDSFFKGARISADHMIKIARGDISVEDAFADNISFQNMSTICQIFKSIDKNLDFYKILNKPYRRRNKTLYYEMEELINKRHNIIHKGIMDTYFDDSNVKKLLNDIEAVIDRSYKMITNAYNWEYDKGWGRGK